MGTVYKAVQKSLERQVAVKVPRPEARIQKHFIAEALANGALEHPNIVPVYDLSHDDNERALMSMKLVQGLSWRDRLKDQAELYENLRILIQVCNAVAFAHSKGVAHMDLKPHNVMIGDYGEVLVMDWGIALDFRSVEERGGDAARGFLKSQLKPGQPFGTAVYCAPEQAEGKVDELGPTTDVYLLGAILHELITGEPPHKKPGFVLKHAAEALPPVFDASVPRELASICRRALGKLPAGRFDTVREFQAALSQFLDHRESLKVAEAAAERWREGQAMRARGQVQDEVARAELYSVFAESIAGFQHALKMWPENLQAAEGERQARVDYARAALDFGDLGLVQSHINKLDPEDLGAERLAHDYDKQKRLRETQLKASRWLKATVFGAATLIFVSVSVGLYFVNQQKQRALRSEQRERSQRMSLEQQKARLISLRIQSDRKSHEVLGQLTEIKLRRAWDIYKQMARINPSRMREAFDDAHSAIKHYQDRQLALPRASLKQSNTQHLKDLKQSFENLKSASVSRHLDRRRRQVLLAHPGQITCLAMNETGETFWTGTDRGLVLEWSLESGQVEKVLARFTAGLRALQYVDHAHLRAHCSDGLLINIDLLQGKSLFQRRLDRRDRVHFHAGTGAVLVHKRRTKIHEVREYGSWMLLQSFASAQDIVRFRGDSRFVILTQNAGPGRTQLELQEYYSWTSRRKPTFPTLPVRVQDVVTAPDGGWVCVIGDNDEVFVANVMNAQKPWVSLGKHPGYKSAVIGNNKLYLSAGGVKSWTLLDNQENSLITEPVKLFQVSGEGQRLVTVDDEGRLRVHSLPVKRSGPARLTHSRARAFLSHLAWSPDSKTLVTSSSQGRLTFWDAQTGQRRQDLDLKRRCQGPFALLDAETLISSRADTIFHWSKKTGKTLKRFTAKGPVQELNFCPQTREFLTVSGRSAQLWSLDKAQPLLTLSSPRLRRFQALRWAPNGQFFLLAHDSVLSLYDRSSLKKVRDWDIRGVRGLQLSPDRKIIAAVTKSGDIAVIDLSQPDTIKSWKSGLRSGAQCQFSRDGEVLIVGGFDEAAVTFWDWRGQRELHSIRSRRHNLDSTNALNLYSDFLLSPDGRSLAVAESDGALNLWSFEPEQWDKVLRRHRRKIRHFDFSPDGQRVATASGDKSLKVWDIETQRCLQTLTEESKVHGCAWSPDGRQLASCTRDGHLNVWDPKTGKRLYSLSSGRSDQIACVFSQDGQFVASLSEQMTLTIWRAQDQNPVFRVAATVPGKIFPKDDFKAHGELLSGSPFQGALAASVLFFEIPSAFVIDKKGFKDLLGSHDMSRKLLLAKDSKILVWDEVKQAVVQRFAGHTKGSICARFVSAGDKVVSAGFNDRLKVWDVFSGSLIRSLKGRHPRSVVFCLQLSKDGRHIWFGTESGELRRWPIASLSKRAWPEHGDLSFLDSWDLGWKLWEDFGQFTPPPAPCFGRLQKH